jgi:hypothetical protein
MLRVTNTFSGTLVRGGGVGNWYYDDTTTEAQDAVDAVVAFWTAIADRIATGITISVSGEVEVVNPSTGLITGVDSATGANISGSEGTEPLSPALQGLVRWRTGVYVTAGDPPRAREIRGRTFIPGPTTGQSLNGVPESDYRTDIAAAAAAYASSGPNASLVYSRTHDQAEPITASSVWDQWAILRSRRD